MVLDNDPDEKCEVCVLSKISKNPFPPSKSLASRIGELTHADICSIGVPTIVGGHTMFLLLTDDSTRFTTIYLLKHKDDAIDSIISYDRKIFNKTGWWRRILQFCAERLLRRIRHPPAELYAVYSSA
jgi:hypothetical protein